jgi:hypothetical protein
MGCRNINKISMIAGPRLQRRGAGSATRTPTAKMKVTIECVGKTILVIFFCQYPTLDGSKLGYFSQN